MNDLLSFIAALVGSLLDPVLMAGCLLAGWYLRPRWVVLVAAVEWNVFIYAVMLKLAFRDESHARFFISGASYLGSCSAAVLAAMLAQELASREQHLREEPVENKPRAHFWPVAWCVGSMLALVAFLAGWVAYAQAVFTHFYNIYGRPVYWERASWQKHYWALEIPGHAGLALAGIALVWVISVVVVRQRPRTRLFPLAALIYTEFFFWVLRDRFG